MCEGSRVISENIFGISIAKNARCDSVWDECSHTFEFIFSSANEQGSQRSRLSVSDVISLFRSVATSINYLLDLLTPNNS